MFDYYVAGGCDNINIFLRDLFKMYPTFFFCFLFFLVSCIPEKKKCDVTFINKPYCKSDFLNFNMLPISRCAWLCRLCRARCLSKSQAMI